MMVHLEGRFRQVPKTHVQERKNINDRIMIMPSGPSGAEDESNHRDLSADDVSSRSLIRDQFAIMAIPFLDLVHPGMRYT